MEDSMDAALRQKWEREDRTEALYQAHEARAIEDLSEELLATHGNDIMRARGLCVLDDHRYDILNDAQMVMLVFGTLDQQSAVRDAAAERMFAIIRNWLTDHDEGIALVRERMEQMERERE